MIETGKGKKKKKQSKPGNLNWEEIAGHVVDGACLGHSSHERMEHLSLGKVSKKGDQQICYPRLSEGSLWAVYSYWRNPAKPCWKEWRGIIKMLAFTLLGRESIESRIQSILKQLRHYHWETPLSPHLSSHISVKGLRICSAWNALPGHICMYWWTNRCVLPATCL